ncbi:MAG TPA: SRPBCC family protein [Candidatus Acidoferrum sp.]|nr:SRPBCC family protein [Candidatus Acidoferrum sp.]
MTVRILIIVAVLVAAVLALAATKPNTFHVQRSISIKAPPEKIFALINDFHSWRVWAPQDKEDPTMNRTYSGPASGKGAISDWDSSGSAGKGRMAIIESVALSMISIKVDFVKPFEAHNINEFTLEPTGALTKVTWALQGTNLYIMKIISICVNMDRVVGKHFESGLNNLKTVAEQ